MGAGALRVCRSGSWGQGEVPQRAVSSFIGRRDALVQLRNALERGGLVTVRGLGGVGKTRLVQEGMVGRDGVVWLHAGNLGAADEIWPLLHEVLGVPAGRGPAALRSLARVQFIVLDRVEHLVGVALTTALRQIAAATPSGCMVLTSRRNTRISGERTVDVQPLGPVEARDLFVDRLATVPGAVASAEVDRIVAALEGLPLALELAAARADVLSLAQLARRVEAPGIGIIAGPGTARHHSLEATLQDSWRLLTDADRDALVALGVFEGTVGIEAAEFVVGGGRALDRLQVLVGHCLVQRVKGEGSEPRLSVLESARAFMRWRRPEPDPMRAAAEARHVVFFHGCGVRWTWPAHRAEIEADRANLERVLACGGCRHVALEIAATLWPIWHHNSPLSELVHRLDGLLEPCEGLPEVDATVQLLRQRAVLHMQLEQHGAAWRDAELAGRIAERIGDPAVRLSAMGLQADVHDLSGRWPEARHALSVLRALAVATGHTHIALQADLRIVGLQAGEPNGVGPALQALHLHRQGSERLPAPVRADLLQLLTRVMLDVPVPPPAAELRGAVELAVTAKTEVVSPVAVQGLVARRVHIGLVHGAVDASARRQLEGQRDQRVDLGSYPLLVRGVMDLVDARVVEARAHLERATGGRLSSEWMTRCRAWAFLALAIAESEAGDPVRAEAALSRGQSLAEELPMLGTEAARRVRACIVATVTEGVGACVLVEPGRSGLEALVDVALYASVRRRRHMAKAWRVAADGTWFAPPSGSVVDLSRRRNQARILAHLVRLRALDSRRAASAQELGAAGWPGMVLTKKSLANRVYVAVAGLRRAGLTTLERAGVGYRLDPDVALMQGGS